MFPHLRRLVRSLRTRRAAAYLFEDDRRVVCSGLFEGLVYPSDISAGSEWLPKLIGSYELEIQDWLAASCREAYGNVINIGCAEGYYAVGLARCMPAAEVHASDADPAARAHCRRLAAVNGVAERVHVHGACTPDLLAELIRDDTLIVCDCEGCEYELLNVQAVPQLVACDIIVELHRLDARDEVPPAWLDGFRATHRIERRQFGPRRVEDFPALDRLPRSLRRFALDENRSRGLSWAFLRAGGY